jgi:hypothetical protein
MNLMILAPIGAVLSLLFALYLAFRIKVTRAEPN